MTTEHIPIDEKSFKKAVLVLQMTMHESKTLLQLREETGITNVEKFVDLLVDMGYVKVIKSGKAYDKYRATVKFQRIKE